MIKASANLIKNLKKQKREDRRLLFLDNIKIIKDALGKGLKPLYIFVCDESLDVWGEKYPVYKVDKTTIEQLSSSKTPQGVVCVAYYLQDVVKKPKTNFLVLDKIQDPGNAGTLIRTATACGIECVFMLDSVAVTNDKLIRSSVGTIFDIDIYEMSEDEFIKNAKEWKLNLVKADMDGENVFTCEFGGCHGVVVGNEGQGVSDKLASLCNRSVKIPMSPKVESLNAAVSGSIIMYQMARDNL